MMNVVIQKKREGWVDALRGVAVVGMVWTHCANTFLDAEVQATVGYSWASYFHGLIAPTFFWLSGWVRGVASRRVVEGKPLWPSVQRLILIFALGHLLHVPWAQWGAGDFSRETWRIFLQADVLQCLALSGLLLLGLEKLGRAVLPAALLLMALVLAATDWLRQVETGWLWVDAYLPRSSGSLFPLFPWVAFALGGMVCGRLKPEPRWLALVGGLSVALIWWLVGPHGTVSFFCERLGWVILFAGVCELLERWLSAGLWPRLLLLMGRRSLSAYVIHLVLIYAMPLGVADSLATLLPMDQSLPAVLGWFMLVLGLTLLCVAALERRKTQLDTAAGRALQ